MENCLVISINTGITFLVKTTVNHKMLEPKAKMIHIPVNSLHFIGASLEGFHFELHGSLRVGDRAVLLVPVVVLHQGWDPFRVHQHVAAKKRGLRFSQINE